MRTIAIDPANANRIYLGIDSGDLEFSTDGGSTWAGITFGAGTSVSADIPWLSWAQNAQAVGDPFFDNAAMQFDPSGSNSLYMTAGIGVWHATPPNTWTGFTWTSQSSGIEQLVANEIISPPGGHLLVGSWDRAVFTINNPDAFPSTYLPTNVNAIVAGWSLDYASNNPSYIAGVVNYGSTQESGYSADGGNTWNDFATVPPGQAQNGSIAAASSTDIVWLPSNAQPYYSTNGGATWKQVTNATSSGWSPYLDRQVVTADRVNIGTFYMYANSGLYRSTDGGATWTIAHGGALSSPFDGFNVKLRSVPNKAGELFFTGGPQNPDSLNSPQNEPFLHSTDGGVTWTAVPNVLEVFDFGFGKAAPGTTTPAIYIVGFVNSKYGIYESDDDAQTWTQIGLWPLWSVDTPKTIAGDMNAYGRVYVGFAGSGYLYGNTVNAQIPPIINNISSGAPTASTAAITWTTDQSSNSEVVYGTTNAYGSATSSTGLLTSHSLALTGLTSSTAYHYAVVSTDAQGYTATTTDHMFTTADTIPPSTPTNLVATPLSPNAISLSWTASTDNVGVVGYQIFRGGSQVGTSTNTTYADIGLATSTMYTYVVTAYDAAGNVSAQSASAATTTLATSSPNNLALNGAAHGNATAVSTTATLTTTQANDVIILFGEANSGPLTAVSDTASLTWHHRADTNSTGNDIEEWYAVASSALSADIITATQTASAFMTIDTFGVSGANTTSPFDSSAVTSTTDPVSISTTHANTMVIGGSRQHTDSTCTAGSGYTLISGADYNAVEYQLLTGPRNLSVTWGSCVGNSNGMIGDTLVSN